MASSSTILLGPPSVAAAVDTPLVKPVTTKPPETPVSDDPSLISKTASLNLGDEPPMGLTENFSPTFLSTGNPCLDFFFHIVPDTQPNDLIQRLVLSWNHDPLTTLKLLCNLRGVRGTGKSDKEGFYTAAFWVYQNHPKTLALNLPALVDFGYLKDLPEILYRILEGQQMERGKTRVWRKRTQRASKRKSDEISGESEITSVPVDKIKARALRKQRELEKAKRALEREEYEGVEEAHYVYKIKDKLRKEVLVSLREALKLPEVSMSAKEWNLLKYNRVTSVAMKTYRKLFAEHDSERFTEFLGDVKSGKARIPAGKLLPFEIIKQFEDDSEGDVVVEVAELQWARMVDDLAKKKKMKNSFVIYDVFGSMPGTPVEVCVALGLLVLELNEEP